MKKFAINIALFLFVILSMAQNAIGRDVIVGEKERFKNIKEAVGFAKDGDHIIIKQGYYWEFGIEIEKQITITGKGSPVIDCMSKGRGILIKSDNVTISGLVIKNIATSNLDELAGIKKTTVWKITSLASTSLMPRTAQSEITKLLVMPLQRVHPVMGYISGGVIISLLRITLYRVTGMVYTLSLLEIRG